jgi:hypothetical protein
MTAWNWWSEMRHSLGAPRGSLPLSRRAVLFGATVLGGQLALPAQAEDQLTPGSATFRDFALPGGSGTLLDQSNTVNRQWMGNTAESLVDVLTVDAAQGLARLRFKSVECEMAVPLGWHAMEDHERGAIFTPDTSIRAIIWRVDLDYEGVGDLERYATAKQGALRARNPAITAVVRRLAGGEYLAMYSNVAPRRGDRDSRIVFDLLTPNPRNARRAMLLTLGAPAPVADRYLPLLALLRRERKVEWRAEL